MADLVQYLLDAGMLQFGSFAHPDGWQPYHLSLELLPSYPAVLAKVAEQALPLVGEVDHLVCLPSALPLAVALSLCTSVPLVYSRGTQESAVFDLVGAYDIGHPTLMLANDLSELTLLTHVMTQARRVGLDIQRILVIVDEGTGVPHGSEVQHLLHLPSAVEHLITTGKLPAGHGQRVLQWINRRRPD